MLILCKLLYAELETRETYLTLTIVNQLYKLVGARTWIHSNKLVCNRKLTPLLAITPEKIVRSSINI